MLEGVGQSPEDAPLQKTNEKSSLRLPVRDKSVVEDGLIKPWKVDEVEGGKNEAPHTKSGFG